MGVAAVELVPTVGVGDCEPPQAMSTADVANMPPARTACRSAWRREIRSKVPPYQEKTKPRFDWDLQADLILGGIISTYSEVVNALLAPAIRAAIAPPSEITDNLATAYERKDGMT